MITDTVPTVLRRDVQGRAAGTVDPVDDELALPGGQQRANRVVPTVPGEDIEDMRCQITEFSERQLTDGITSSFHMPEFI